MNLRAGEDDRNIDNLVPYAFSAVITVAVAAWLMDAGIFSNPDGWRITLARLLLGYG
jgi:hypothetical protein